MAVASAFSLRGWVEEHRHLLKPPVGNACVYPDTDFIVMVVGGPNRRKDYHVNPTEELFYQLEGDITVKIIDDGVKRDIHIREGDMFLLPPLVPHSPQRGPNTVGLVIERKRPEGQNDHLRYYCEKCDNILFDPEFYLTDIARQLKPLMETFWGDEKLRTCKKCGTVMQPPAPAA
ncbi:MAG: 3-hydroxyanthranilate 3,4-dioxygenase [Phycisphaerales bacterium]|nr:MAG: 3-hydroxyanthranilate 3,4-dioxygenase [Phycisphaerales bacterium]